MKRIAREAKLGENSRAEQILKQKREIARLDEEISGKDNAIKNLRWDQIPGEETHRGARWMILRHERLSVRPSLMQFDTAFVFV